MKKRYILIELGTNTVCDVHFLNSIKYLKNNKPLWGEHKIGKFFVSNNSSIELSLDYTFAGADIAFTSLEAASEGVELLAEFGFQYYPKEIEI